MKLSHSRLGSNVWLHCLAIGAKSRRVFLHCQKVLPSHPLPAHQLCVQIQPSKCTDISDAKTRFGLEEYIEERFASSSIADFASFNITIVCPSTVIELTGPEDSLRQHVFWKTRTGVKANRKPLCVAANASSLVSLAAVDRIYYQALGLGVGPVAAGQQASGGSIRIWRHRGQGLPETN